MITAKTSYRGQEGTESLTGKLNFEQDNNRIIGRDEDNIPRLLILADGVNFSMKVAQAGFDATTATGDELIFNSDQNMFKIVKKIPIAFNISSGAGGATSTFSHNHNLGYQPLVIGSVQLTGSGGLSGVSGLVPLPYLLPAISSASGVGPWGTIAASISATIVTSTSVTFNYFLMPNSGLSGTITLYVLQETAN